MMKHDDCQYVQDERKLTDLEIAMTKKLEGDDSQDKRERRETYEIAPQKLEEILYRHAVCNCVFMAGRYVPRRHNSPET